MGGCGCGVDRGEEVESVDELHLRFTDVGLGAEDFADWQMNIRAERGDVVFSEAHFLLGNVFPEDSCKAKEGRGVEEVNVGFWILFGEPELGIPGGGGAHFLRLLLACWANGGEE